jgi:hypothetical protein
VTHDEWTTVSVVGVAGVINTVDAIEKGKSPFGIIVANVAVLGTLLFVGETINDRFAMAVGVVYLVGTMFTTGGPILASLAGGIGSPPAAQSVASVKASNAPTAGHTITPNSYAATSQ